MLNIDLTDRVALVLGGSRGIGAGIVESLCQAGATAWFTHRGQPRHADAVDALLARTQAEPGRAIPVQADACQSAQTQRVVDQVVARHNRIDALVCNVGQTLRAAGKGGMTKAGTAPRNQPQLGHVRRPRVVPHMAALVTAKSC